MKKSLLLFVLLLTALLGYGQTITINSSPATLRACDTVNFTVTVNNIVANDILRIRIKNSANTQFLSTNVPFNITNNYIQIDTIVNASTFVFNYSNRLTCNASRLNIDNISTDNFTDSIKVKRNNLNEISTTRQYSANNPYYQYINNTYTAVSGDVNENIIGNLRFRNFNAPFSGFFQIIERMPTGSSIVSINVHGEQIISHTFDNTTNTYTTIVKVNSNDTLFYQPTYQINACNYSSANRFVTVNMGCSVTDICKNLVTNLSAPYNYVRKEATITVTEFIQELSPNTCNIEKSWKRTYVFKNTSQRDATDINVRPYRNFSGNNIPIYSFALIQDGSVEYSLSNPSYSTIVDSSFRTSTTNVCGTNTSIASTKTNRLGFNDTLGTYAIIDRLAPGDSIILTYITYRCCEENLGPFSFQDDQFPSLNNIATSVYNSSNLGAVAHYKAHPCNTNFSAAAKNTSTFGSLNVSQYPLCNTTHILGDLRDGSSEGESFSASIVNLTYSNSLFAANDTSHQIWVKIESELGLYNKDSIYFQTQDGSKKWRAYFISDTTTFSSNLGWKHERWAYFRKSDLPTSTTIQTFFSNNSTINYTMQSYCMAKPSKTAYRVTTYIKETDCNGCLMPIISGSCAVAVQCPGCFLPGTLVRKTTVERKSFGFLDANNDRLPDNYPTKADPTNPQILKNRVMYGDTLEVSMNLVVWDTPNGDISLNSLADSNKFLNRAYGILTIPGGGGMRILNTTIHFNGQSRTISSSDSVGNVPVLFKRTLSKVISRTTTKPSDTLSIGSLIISYDVSLDVLVSLGFNINGRTHFLENDTITISSNLVFDKHIGRYFIESELVSQAYMSGAIPSNRFEKPTDYFTTALPSTIDSIDISKSFWCEDFGGYMSMVDYIFSVVPYSGFTEPNTLSNCGRTLALNYKAEFPVFLNDYFPYEYRNVLAVTKAKVILPPNYEILNNIGVAWTEASSINPIGLNCNERRITIPVINNELNTAPFNTYVVTNCPTRNDIILLDEQCAYNVAFQYRPTCNNLVAAIDTNKLGIDIEYTSLFTNQNFSIRSPFNTNQFNPILSATQSQTQAATTEFNFQPVKIKNIQTAIFGGNNNYRTEYYKNAPNVFVAFKDARTSIVSINNTPYSSGSIYPLGNLKAIDYNVNVGATLNEVDLQITASYNCIGLEADKFDKQDSVLMYFGWSCNGYIDSLPQIYQSQSCLFVDSVYHYIKPLPLTKEIALATGKDTLDNCDTTSMRILLRSMSQGNLYDLVGSVIVEVPASMQPCSDSATIRYKNSNNTIATDKIGVLLDSSIPDRYRYIYDLTPFTQNGLSNGDSITITGCLQTTCTESDTANILLKTSSIAYCGDIIRQQREIQLYIQPYQPQVRDTITVACNSVSLVNSSGTLNLTVSSNQSAVSQYNSLQLAVPNSIEINTNNTGWSGSNGVYQYNLDDIEQNIPQTITANLSTSQSFDCNDTIPYQVQLIQLDTVLCNAAQCQRFYIADSCSGLITIGCDTITIITPDTTICEGNSLSLSAFTNNTNTTIFWTANGNVINPINYTPNTIGSITVIAQIQNSTVADTMYITVNPDCLCPTRFHYIWGSDVGIPEISASDAAFSSNSKNVLVQGRLKIKGLNSSSVLTLNRWNFSVNSQNEGAQIELEDLLFTCNGCSFVAACDTLWGGIVLHNNAGIRLDSINNKASIIRQAITGIRNNPNSTGFRQFSVNKTNFIDCVRGINLINYQRNFVVATDKISNNRFITNNNQLIAWGGYLITNTLRYAINLEQADYYNIRIQQNTINNTGLGIRLANATGYAFENTIINCLTGINTIGSYYNTRTYDIQLRRNTILLAPEGHDYNLIGQNYFNVTGIFSSGLKAYINNNTIRANFQHREYLNRQQYRGIFISADRSYVITDNTINVRDIALEAQNLSTVQGQIIGNNLSDHYRGVNFVANNWGANPKIALRCNDFSNTWLDPSGNSIKTSIFINPNTHLKNLGGCRTNANSVYTQPCGNKFPNTSFFNFEYQFLFDNGIDTVFYYANANEENFTLNSQNYFSNARTPPYQICTSTTACISRPNPNGIPLEPNPSNLSELALAINPQEIAQLWTKLVQSSNAPNPNSGFEVETIPVIVGYYIKINNLSALENMLSQLANGSRAKLGIQNALYTVYLEKNEFANAANKRNQMENEYAANSEISKNMEFLKTNEKLGNLANQSPILPSVADSIAFASIATSGTALHESACRRINAVNCNQTFASALRQQKNIPDYEAIRTYWKSLDTTNDSLNLIPNYSFELIDTCGTSAGQLELTGWKSYSSTPDAFNTCFPLSSYASIPKNGRGFQHVNSGQGYMGSNFITGQNYLGETPGTILKETLIPGTKYYFGMKVNLSEGSGVITNKFGALFSTNEWAVSNTLPIPNFAHVYTDSVISDTLHWTPIFGSFETEIDSNYNFVYLGTFFSWSSLIKIGRNGIGGCLTCYYIDDVVLSKDSAYVWDITHTNLLVGVKPTNYELRATKDNIKLYPNPTNGTVFINMPNPNKVYVYNTLGILTKELYLEKGEHEIDISNFPSGVYLFRIANESIKLIKE
jgi:hypothetical protein